MSENMALLSQNEIDALVKFLLEKQNIKSGVVLDQGSIDRLVNVLQDKTFIQKMGSVTEEPMQNATTKTVAQLLLLEGEQDIVAQQTNYELIFECDAEGMIQVVCQSKLSTKRHVITPSCLEQSRYTEEESVWGKTISPIVFDTISGMLHIRYSKDTFLRVCDRFAEVVYGNKNAEIPSFYMPNASSLMQHMLG